MGGCFVVITIMVAGVVVVIIILVVVMFVVVMFVVVMFVVVITVIVRMPRRKVGSFTQGSVRGDVVDRRDGHVAGR